MKLANAIGVMPLVAAFALAGSPAMAEDRSAGEAVNDARLEGQLWASYALNRHLNPFDLEVDVKDGKATLKGEVEESVQRDLAEEIAAGISGIDDVDNRIEVVSDRQVSDQRSEGRSFGDRISDATTTATVKSKLLWNRNTEGLSIEVSTADSVVTLEGQADSDASKQLAERLAENTDGVEKVDNRITVAAQAGTGGAMARDSDRDAGDTVSDAWITSKVKSTLLFSSAVSGTDISVETRDGVVTLEGEVGNDAEKALAVELARDIRGVKDVDDSELRVETS